MRAFVAASVAAGTNHWLGRVLVANMPGSVVFIGFALGRVPVFSLLASLGCLVWFLIGAFLGASLWSSSPGTEDSCWE